MNTYAEGAAYVGNIQDAINALRLNNHRANTTLPSGTPNVGAPLGYRPPTSIDKGLHDSYKDKEMEYFNRTGSDMASRITRSGYTSFSGADTTVAILFKNGTPTILGECQTVSYSIFTPMQPVYNLGTNKASGFVKGPRTVAGSIIFTVFDRHAIISAFHSSYSNYQATPCLNKEYLSDELPPFDLQVTFMNEYGQSAALTIHDVRITSEGQVQSIEDMITENTMQYIATDITLMQPDFSAEPI